MRQIQPSSTTRSSFLISRAADRRECTPCTRRSLSLLTTRCFCAHNLQARYRRGTSRIALYRDRCALKGAHARPPVSLAPRLPPCRPLPPAPRAPASPPHVPPPPTPPPPAAPPPAAPPLTVTHVAWTDLSKRQVESNMSQLGGLAGDKLAPTWLVGDGLDSVKLFKKGLKQRGLPADTKADIVFTCPP